MKKMIATVVAGSLLVGALGTAAHAGGKSKATVVGKDAADDWGANVDPAIAPLGEALGQELVQASIGMADARTVNFVIKVAFLPPPGGTPEVTRYLWDMTVDFEQVQLDGKFTNYSRGICDPTSGQCPPPRDPGLQPFFVRGDCEAAGASTVCQEKAVVKATFDAAAGTITVPVSLKLLGAKAGSKIGPANFFLGGVAAIPAAFGSSTAMPFDQLMPTRTFIVPRSR